MKFVDATAFPQQPAHIRKLVTTLRDNSDLFREALKTFGVENQLRQCQEELFEYLADNSPTPEETADVLIMLSQVILAGKPKLVVSLDIPSAAQHSQTLAEVGVAISHLFRGRTTLDAVSEKAAFALSGVIEQIRSSRAVYTLEVYDRKTDNLLRLLEDAASLVTTGRFQPIEAPSTTKTFIR